MARRERAAAMRGRFIARKHNAAIRRLGNNAGARVDGTSEKTIFFEA
jgi:hypothetical protein